MITWILGGILIVWCLIKRFKADGRVEGQPLGMPRGTVRAMITILIVSFPFSFILIGEDIPGLIINAIFIVVAFYFEARKPGQDRMKSLIKEIKNPDKYDLEVRKEKKPLYLPKYTVRFTIITLLASIVILNALGPTVPFEATNTLVDILLILALYIVGGFFRGIGVLREKGKLKSKIIQMENYQSLSKYEILEKLEKLEKPSWWKQKGKNFLSIMTLTSVVTALICYTINWDLILLTLPFYEFSLRETLLLFISVYYGFRE